MTKTTRSYRYGGPLVVGQDYYIPRKADDQLLQLCLQSEYAYVFNASQTGKSSLLERTRDELDRRGICAVYIDLQALGFTADAEEWYRNVADMIAARLGLRTDIETWWAAHSSQTPTRRWMTFFEQVLVTEIKKPVVIFIDEVDRTRSLPFRSDIYGALRSLYSGRTTRPELRRLSFVLAGLAAPQQLIVDSTQTAHNIWKGVSLGDLTEKDGASDELAEGLGLRTAQNRKQALNWILSWTAGHPYLTQKMCARVQDQEWTDCEAQDVDQLVAQEFLNGENEDNNLSYVEKELTKERENGLTRDALLAEYERVWTDGRVRDTNTATQAEMKLTGVVKVEDGWLRVRNRIYREAFDKKWLRLYFRPGTWDWLQLQPRSIQRSFTLIAIAMGALVVTLIALIGTTYWALDQQQQANQAAQQALATKQIAENQIQQFAVMSTKLASDYHELRAEGAKLQATIDAIKIQTERATGIPLSSGMAGCEVAIGHSLVVLMKEPKTFSQEIIRIPVGIYETSNYQEEIFGGQTRSWFQIKVGEHVGWIQNNTWTIAAKTDACP